MYKTDLVALIITYSYITSLYILYEWNSTENGKMPFKSTSLYFTCALTTVLGSLVCHQFYGTEIRMSWKEMFSIGRARYANMIGNILVLWCVQQTGADVGSALAFARVVFSAFWQATLQKNVPNRDMIATIVIIMLLDCAYVIVKSGYYSGKTNTSSLFWLGIGMYWVAWALLELHNVMINSVAHVFKDQHLSTKTLYLFIWDLPALFIAIFIEGAMRPLRWGDFVPFYAFMWVTIPLFICLTFGSVAYALANAYDVNITVLILYSARYTCIWIKALQNPDGIKLDPVEIFIATSLFVTALKWKFDIVMKKKAELLDPVVRKLGSIGKEEAFAEFEKLASDPIFREYVRRQSHMKTDPEDESYGDTTSGGFRKFSSSSASYTR